MKKEEKPISIGGMPVDYVDAWPTAPLIALYCKATRRSINYPACSLIKVYRDTEQPVMDGILNDSRTMERVVNRITFLRLPPGMFLTVL